MNICLEFQEEYKKLDKLCKDIFSSCDGVSEYIRQMENTPYKNKIKVKNWDDIYNTLKHLRWIRNQLAHEVGSFESSICTEKDLQEIKSFYQEILSLEDPLVLVKKQSVKSGCNEIKEKNCFVKNFFSKLRKIFIKG